MPFQTSQQQNEASYLVMVATKSLALVVGLEDIPNQTPANRQTTSAHQEVEAGVDEVDEVEVKDEDEVVGGVELEVGRLRDLASQKGRTFEGSIAAPTLCSLPSSYQPLRAYPTLVLWVWFKVRFIGEHYVRLAR
jgi:hypothetical protein